MASLSSSFSGRIQRLPKWSSSTGSSSSSSTLTIARTIQRRNKDTTFAGRSKDNTKKAAPCNCDEAAAPALSWRMEQSESFSDWTIEIGIASSSHPSQQHLPQGNKTTDSSTTTTETYHVHRNMLAVGPFRSDYFAALFRRRGGGDNFSESIDSTIRITELHPMAAKAFPKLLDYFYSSSGQGNAVVLWDDKSAVALHHLAQYFQVSRLEDAAYEYCKTHLTQESCGMFYQQSLLLHDDCILHAVVDYCAGCICYADRRFSAWIDSCAASSSLRRLDEQYDDDDWSDWPSIVDVADPVFWVRVLTRANTSQIPSEQASCYASELISTVLTTHLQKDEHQIDGELFCSLTDDRFLPVLDFTAAWYLLQVHDKLVVSGSSSNSTDHDVDGLTCLQKRCVTSIAQNWARILTVKSEYTVFVSLKKQSPTLLAYLMAKVLDRASTGRAATREQLINVKRELAHFKRSNAAAIDESEEKGDDDLSRWVTV